MPRSRPSKLKTEIPAPLADANVGRLIVTFGTAAHGYENRIVVSALLHFASTWLVTQIAPPYLGKMVDKFCQDLTELAAEKETKRHALDQGVVAPAPKKPKKKAEKARSLRR